ncbi:SET domain-containing protein 4 [Camelus dromedarius]|uniref:SET domain-containing protein 4 n=1 Tax=Camelus dromedarius TaxID=9838 RepID=A0A5N4EJL4_CAMDR|nr:SET domain-containing protein 4 [Camelus dromedarius]KAB1283718.1 SET domain-containing protein 4 [Camelus dromedarius]
MMLRIILRPSSSGSRSLGRCRPEKPLWRRSGDAKELQAGMNESYKPEFIELKKWLKDRKFEDANLIPARFPGEVWHSARTYRKRPDEQNIPTEKHAGNQSPWKPYLEVLPEAYTCPVCLEPEVAVESIFSHSALLWAWCTVNTRAVYMKRPPRPCLSAEPDTYALAPYLDLLNHSPRVQVKAAFNEETRCYEIRTATSCRKHEEVFICYGPHDNHRLLLEYGFVPVRNPHACVYVSEG